MAEITPPRWQQRLRHLQQAMTNLENACGREEYSELERAGLIKMFELAFELAWKCWRDLLRFEGLEFNSPREVWRGALSAGLLSADITEKGLETLDQRDLLAHIYNEAMAQNALELICRDYLPWLREVHRALEMRRTEA